MNFIEALKGAGKYGRIRNKNWNYDESIGLDEYFTLNGIYYEDLISNQWEIMEKADL